MYYVTLSYCTVLYCTVLVSIFIYFHSNHIFNTVCTYVSQDMQRETSIGKGTGDKTDVLKRAVLHLQRYVLLIAILLLVFTFSISFYISQFLISHLSLSLSLSLSLTLSHFLPLSSSHSLIFLPVHLSDPLIRFFFLLLFLSVMLCIHSLFLFLSLSLAPSPTFSLLPFLFLQIL